MKKGVSCQGARLLPRETAHDKIQKTTAVAVGKASRGEIDPMPVERPVTVRREMVERGSIPSAGTKPSLRILDGRTYETTADTVEKAFFSL